MCRLYKCKDCKEVKQDFCNDWDDWVKKCVATSGDLPWNTDTDRKCHTCETICGAIISLRNLVYREPWLLTEGMAGAPKKEDWEVEDKGATPPWAADYDSDGNDDDGWTKEERKALRKAAEDAMAGGPVVAPEDSNKNNDDNNNNEEHHVDGWMSVEGAKEAKGAEEQEVEDKVDNVKDSASSVESATTQSASTDSTPAEW